MLHLDGQCADQTCRTPANVVQDIALPKAMASDPTSIGIAIREHA